MPPRLARLLAAVVALALVAGAFVLRGALAGDDDEPGADGRDTPAGGGGGGGDEGSFQVLCDEDLGEAVCAALGEVDAVDEVRVVSLGDVLAAAAAPADEAAIDLTAVDAWLTLDPMPALLDEARRGAQPQPLTDERAQVEVGSSTLALLTFASGSLACSPASWRCLAESAATQDVGVPGRDTSTGLAVIGASFGAIGGQGAELRGIGAFEGETADLVRAVAEGAEGTVAEQQGTLVTQRGRYDGIVTTDGWADRRAGTSTTAGLVVAPLTPETTVGVVLAGLGIQGVDAVDALADAVTGQTVADALADAGWDGEAVRSDGLPDSDVIYALREELG